MDQIEKLSSTEVVSMSDDWYEIANHEHFWMKWRFEIFKFYFSQNIPKTAKILEIGCGNGVFRDQLENCGYVVDGCDLNLFALKLANRGKGRLIYYNIFDLAPELIGKYDLIILMDVIEHIDNDVEFLRIAGKHLNDDGLVLINVPAYKYLFSKYDTEAGHHRRYTKGKLNKVLEKSGFVPIKTGYWGLILIPIAIIRKIHLYFIK